MTKHFTHAEFANKFLDEFSYVGYKSGNACDRILATIFTAHRQEIADHLEGVLAYMDVAVEQGLNTTTHEFVGYNFHKGFRQIDPIDAPLLNGIVWTCISSSDEFWTTLHEVSELHDKGVEKVSKALDTLDN